jgi:DnaJ-class molecular chaperone
VASKKTDSENDGSDQAEESHGPQECMPCRGSGQVISNLGGAPNSVPCPWCKGTGTRESGIDAQQSWLEQNEAGAESDVPSGEAA